MLVCGFFYLLLALLMQSPRTSAGGATSAPMPPPMPASVRRWVPHRCGPLPWRAADGRDCGRTSRRSTASSTASTAASSAWKPSSPTASTTGNAAWAASGKAKPNLRDIPRRVGRRKAKVRGFGSGFCLLYFACCRSTMFRPNFSCRWLLAVSCALFVAGCADNDHQLVISVPEQRMAVLYRGTPQAIYPVSTSRFCLSGRSGSYGTPEGELEIAEKIGDGLPAGAVLKSRRPTGEVLAVDAPGTRPRGDAHPLAARPGSAQRQFLRPRHLHPRHARGTPHRHAGQLRLHPHAFARTSSRSTTSSAQARTFSSKIVR